MTPESMAVIASEYQTVVTIVSLAGSAAERVLKINPKRWYAGFYNGAGGQLMALVLPGPPLTFGAFPNFVNAPQEWKWKDCPSIVSGEFYAYSGLVGSLICIECIYVGRDE